MPRYSKLVQQQCSKSAAGSDIFWSLIESRWWFPETFPSQYLLHLLSGQCEWSSHWPQLYLAGLWLSSLISRRMKAPSGSSDDLSIASQQHGSERHENVKALTPPPPDLLRKTTAWPICLKFACVINGSGCRAVAVRDNRKCNESVRSELSGEAVSVLVTTKTTGTNHRWLKIHAQLSRVWEREVVFVPYTISANSKKHCLKMFLFFRIEEFKTQYLNSIMNPMWSLFTSQTAASPDHMWILKVLTHISWEKKVKATTIHFHTQNWMLQLPGKHVVHML